MDLETARALGALLSIAATLSIFIWFLRQFIDIFMRP